MNELSLDGTWKAIGSPEQPEDFSAIDYDDAHWLPIELPSHWSTQPGFGRTSGTVLFRKRFSFSQEDNRRTWLHFGGVFSHANVWVDNTYAGELEGYFAPHAFDISAAVAEQTEHVVAVEVNAPSFDVPWAAPGGLWQPVRVKKTGAVRIARLKVLCAEATDERAVLSISVELDSNTTTEVAIRTRITAAMDTTHPGADDLSMKRLAVGRNRIQWDVTVDEPDLWWPWNLGKQPLFDVCVEVAERHAPDDISDTSTVRTGLRQVSFDNGFTYVNGTRVFLQSIESGNDGTLPIETDVTYFLDLIAKRRECGANLLVRSQWIEPQAFYDVADELGMLVWQGVPFASDDVPHMRHARQMVEVLGSHPSIALWLRPMKRIRDWRPMPDALKRTLERSDASRANVEHPAGWDLHRLSPRDVYEIAPSWAKRSRFLYFTSDPREAAGHVEALRLLRFKPLGGYLAPMALPELLGGACDAVRLVALPKEPLAQNSEVNLEIFLINESQTPITDAVISVTVPASSLAVGQISGRDATWKWSGEAAADSVSFIGDISFDIHAIAAVDLILKLDTGETLTRTLRLPVRPSSPKKVP